MFARLKVSAGYMNIKKAIQFRSNKYVSSVLVVHSTPKMMQHLDGHKHSWTGTGITDALLLVAKYSGNYCIDDLSGETVGVF